MVRPKRVSRAPSTSRAGSTVGRGNCAPRRAGRLWQRQGRREEARAALGAVYGCYSEGFAMPDSRQCKVPQCCLRCRPPQRSPTGTSCRRCLDSTWLTVSDGWLATRSCKKPASPVCHDGGRYRRAHRVRPGRAGSRVGRAARAHGQGRGRQHRRGRCSACGGASGEGHQRFSASGGHRRGTRIARGVPGPAHPRIADRTGRSGRRHDPGRRSGASESRCRTVVAHLAEDDGAAIDYFESAGPHLRPLFSAQEFERFASLIEN